MTRTNDKIIPNSSVINTVIAPFTKHIPPLTSGSLQNTSTSTLSGFLQKTSSSSTPQTYALLLFDRYSCIDLTRTGINLLKCVCHNRRNLLSENNNQHDQHNQISTTPIPDSSFQNCFHLFFIFFPFCYMERNAAYKIITNTISSINIMGNSIFVPAFSPASLACSLRF